jgi:TRAP-type C4-dicarboxylate transport system substrate-binding protein
LKFYPGGVMGNDQTVLRKIRIGQLHGGAVTSGALAEIYPDAQIYSLPMLIRSMEEVNYVRKRMDAAIEAGLEKHGLVNIGISNGGFAYFAGHNRVASVADLKRQRVWIPQGDRVATVMLQTAGVSPIPLPLSDVYTALQTGLLDTVAVTLSGMIAFQWHTKVKYVTDSPMAFVIGMLVIDKRAVDQLQPADRKILSDVMHQKFRNLDAITQRDDEEARKALQLAGIEFVQSTAAEKESWLAILNTALVDLQKQGAFSAEFLQQLQKHLSVYRSQAK